MKGNFVRKPDGIGDLIKARGMGRPEPIIVIATVNLEPADFEHFANNLLEDYNFIEEHTGKCGVDREGNAHCILIGTSDRQEKIAVESEGYNYARYAALIIEEEK